MTDLKAWPHREAATISAKIEREEDTEHGRQHDYVLFETGFGPSGLPHVGTFSEVARTTWVMRAHEWIADGDTRLFAFSDDMDGLRKVPDNLPQKGMLQQHLGKPLCDIPDPFGEEDSFSGYMNAKFRSFLDHFGFDYEFKSSKDQYRGGVFDEGLLQILRKHEEVRGVIVPTLGHRKDDDTDRSDWSPFMPICDACGKVYTTRVTGVHPADGEVSYVCDESFRGCDACGHEGRTPVTGGNVKVGWKVDWALRWYVFGVDYEMYGKDLIDPAELSAEIVRILGGEPPVGFFYEMFLDENGQKISKSVGKGLTIDEWLQYGPLESLGWFIYQNPEKAKKLHFDVIPRSVDDWLEGRAQFAEESDEKRLNNPIWFIEHDRVEAGDEIGYACDVSFSMLLNLVNVLNTNDADIVWEYILRYDADAADEKEVVDRLIDRALRYYEDFVLPTKRYEVPGEEMSKALDQLCQFLESYEGDDAEEIQTAAYAAGKENGVKLGKWFRAMYRLLLGQDRGPRLGTFIHLYGVEETLTTIRERVEEEST